MSVLLCSQLVLGFFALTLNNPTYDHLHQMVNNGFH